MFCVLIMFCMLINVLCVNVLWLITDLEIFIYGPDQLARCFPYQTFSATNL